MGMAQSGNMFISSVNFAPQENIYGSLPTLSLLIKESKTYRRDVTDVHL